MLIIPIGGEISSVYKNVTFHSQNFIHIFVVSMIIRNCNDLHLFRINILRYLLNLINFLFLFV